MYFLLKMVIFQCHVGFQGCMGYVKSLEKTSRFNSSHVKGKSMKSSHVFLYFWYEPLGIHPIFWMFLVYTTRVSSQKILVFSYISLQISFFQQGSFAKANQLGRLSHRTERGLSQLGRTQESHQFLERKPTKITTELRFVDFFCGGNGQLIVGLGPGGLGRGTPKVANPFHKGIPGIQTTNPNQQVTIR